MTGVRRDFEGDPHPGRPRILLVGLAESTHTHAWVELLAGARLNLRLFALPTFAPPPLLTLPTYVSAAVPITPERADRAWLPLPGVELGALYRLWTERRLGLPGEENVAYERGELALRWLADIVQRWRPHVVHTLGIDPASTFFARARSRFALAGAGAWLAQDRGPDLWMQRHLPERAGPLREVLSGCDALICDNHVNVALAPDLGLRPGRLAPLGLVPATGGIDVDGLAKARSQAPPAARRLVYWPKAYDCAQSLALPVLEAIRLAWDRLQPCEIRMTAATPETRMWFETLPEGVRRGCRIEERVPREVSLGLMARARVMLAPSLSDGLPNTLWEAMATGALPIVSPIEPIRRVVEDGRHGLLARNLHPDEIAAALVRALTDDALVERAAHENLGVVRAYADRRTIGPRVVSYYEELAAASRA